MTVTNKFRVAVLGACGHIGLPLSVSLANAGFEVVGIDKNSEVVKQVSEGDFPFVEIDGEKLLGAALESGNLTFSSQVSQLSDCQAIIVCIGTPVDENLSPIPRIFEEIIEEIVPFIKSGSNVILRSTVFPGTTRLVEKRLHQIGAHVSFCPERILQGYAFVETKSLPNIISGCCELSVLSAKTVFEKLGPVLEGTIEASELAKLFLNAYRYINFAISNEFFTISNDAGVDYAEVMKLMKTDYPRANSLPKPGLAAGPCLMKDTMQILAFAQNKFLLGNSAFLANEGLATYLAKSLKAVVGYEEKTVGLLGMSFKAESDDIRSSLSYRVKKTLQLMGIRVICADPLVRDDKTLVPVNQLMESADIVIICTPHEIFKGLVFEGKYVLDIWSLVSETLNLHSQLETRRN
jgi:UDP-N-acetyl-D-mannosaminuronic acid dehydrogenase